MDWTGRRDGERLRGGIEIAGRRLDEHWEVKGISDVCKDRNDHEVGQKADDDPYFGEQHTMDVSVIIVPDSSHHPTLLKHQAADTYISWPLFLCSVTAGYAQPTGGEEVDRWVNGERNTVKEGTLASSI